MFEYHHPSIGGSLPRLFSEVIRIWPKFTCLKVLKIIFENPETGKIKTKIMRALWGPYYYYYYYYCRPSSSKPESSSPSDGTVTAALAPVREAFCLS